MDTKPLLFDYLKESKASRGDVFYDEHFPFSDNQLTPNFILFDNGLTHREKIFLIFIYNLKFSKDQLSCFASNEYLSKIMGVNKNTISNMISNLKKRGYIICRRSAIISYLRYIDVIDKK